MKRARNVLVLALSAAVSGPGMAFACGCFTPPDPSVPVVQAGERILFSMEDGEVTAHIQIQYAGDAGEFGWLLPLPSVPGLELGTDELFNNLITTTQPKYRLNRRFEGNCLFAQARGAGGPLAGLAGAPSEDASEGAPGPSPLVIQDSIGPYDYAVLRADSKDAMLGWLAENRYFVPAGTDESVGPYIRPGAYFLALKLRSGQSAGDLQPVVVRYRSDLPMIPIVLTSVAAQPNMGIQVWMLGAGRAIPRNYYHTIVNDALIDWLNAGRNYNDVIIRAVGEAPGRHSFVTEYAGSSWVMRNRLDYPGRFGSRTELEARPDAISFVEYLQRTGFAFTSQLVAILTRYIPPPPRLVEAGISAASWFQRLAYYLSDSFRARNPQLFEGWPGLSYDPVRMAAEIDERVVQPTRAAGALFEKHPVLTRLYTTLSPEDMNRDPVFSFNPELPPVQSTHEATIVYECGLGSRDQATTPARLVTEQGYVIRFPAGTGAGPLRGSPVPASTAIQVLTEEGPPLTITDNQGSIRRSFGAGGCTVGGGGASIAFALLAVALGLAASRRARSRR